MIKKILSNSEYLGAPANKNRDRTTIVIGVLLILLFSMITYFSINSEGFHSGPKPKGPVKNPHSFLHDPESQSYIGKRGFSELHRASHYCSVSQDFLGIA
ncbi:MAG: hypothetical protein ACP5U1_05185 [Desulfomonilaceae bacterium]